jgi:hypothetical protein
VRFVRALIAGVAPHPRQAARTARRPGKLVWQRPVHRRSSGVPIRPASCQPRRLRRAALAVALAAAPLLPAAAPAQGADPGRVVTAVRARGAIRVDGRLDEATWAAAHPAADFVQTVPSSGAPASERSEVRVLFDRGSLYVGFRLHDSRPDSIAAQLARRDAGGIYTDWAHVAIDSYHDRRTAWRFSLNPRGVQADGSIFNDTERDPLWDAVWEGASAIDSLGWTAEFRIPLSQLRYSARADGGVQVWGINFAREIARRGERAYWSPTPPDAPGVVSRMGTLVGLDSLADPSRLELIPYARAQVTRAPGSAANPFYDPTDGGAAAGLDLRYRLPRNLTFSASVNPDFGQVEADPAVVNLSAFEVFFPERRPFFLEGQDVFRFGGTRTFNDDDRPNFFYTRRLGRAPQRRLGGADVEWVDAPARRRSSPREGERQDAGRLVGRRARRRDAPPDRALREPRRRARPRARRAGERVRHRAPPPRPARREHGARRDRDGRRARARRPGVRPPPRRARGGRRRRLRARVGEPHVGDQRGARRDAGVRRPARRRAPAARRLPPVPASRRRPPRARQRARRARRPVQRGERREDGRPPLARLDDVRGDDARVRDQRPRLPAARRPPHRVQRAHATARPGSARGAGARVPRLPAGSVYYSYSANFGGDRVRAARR